MAIWYWLQQCCSACTWTTAEKQTAQQLYVVENQENSGSEMLKDMFEDVGVSLNKVWDIPLFIVSFPRRNILKYKL